MNESHPLTNPPAGEALTDAEQGADSEASTLRAFRADLNHKLRTPLNAILGYAELLALRTGSGRENGDVKHILNSARELLAIIEHDLAEPNPKTSVESPASAATTPCDVLYVEDDIVNFTLVERILEYRPAVNVMHAPQGKMGVEMAQIYRPKLVLLDLNLPDMHGSEVLQLLQQNPATADIPVVILSANATPSQIERLLAAGAKNYLTKPYGIDPFLAVVDEFTVAAA